MTQATDDVYYLYVGNGWSGPFRIDQIRVFVKDKQISPDTYAFEPQQQMQLTVSQLLADPNDAPTGAFQSASAPKSDSSQKLDQYDAKRTVVGDAQTAANRKQAEDDVIDLDAVSTSSTKRRQDDDVIDLDAVATSSQRAPKSRRDDDEIIDLDRGTSRNDKLSVEIDEPKGRPADSTLSKKAPATRSEKAGASEALEVVLGELENLRRAYNALMENSMKDREDSQGKVHVAHLAINEVLEERKSDIAEIRSLVAEIDQVATDLAKRHRDPTLSTRIIRLRDSLHDADVAQMVQGAEAVLRRIVEQFDRAYRADKEKGEEHPFPDDSGAQRVAAIAGDAELKLGELRSAYDDLQSRLTAETEAARERLLTATAQLEAARQAQQHDSTELRALAHEIYRLACDLDPHWLPRETYDRVQKLYEELTKPDAPPAAMAPDAGRVLVGVVKALKERAELAPIAGATGAHGRQAKELGAMRAELLQTRTDLTLMRQREQALQEEKARLQQLLDEQKQISEKAQQAAKAREQRLRSTVCALEVTKELHQDVMRDLQVQLASAQGKVEDMEQQLRSVRGELTSRREKSRGADDVHAEMRRVVEMRAMLDARKEELSADLQSTEAELKRVGDQDESLSEMLAEKVNAIRKTYETTLKRLEDQESKAQSLAAELEASRQEAGELRGRSDGLNAELENARANLSAAKKRVDELNLAYQRLDTERESLQQELTQRNSTRFFRGDDALAPELKADEIAADQAQTDVDTRLIQAQRQAQSLEAEAARERRRADDLAAEHQALAGRVAELGADRDHLRAEFERLSQLHTDDQLRLSQAVATATQAAIEAESRQRAATARIAELERQSPAPAADTDTARAEVERLQEELAEARRGNQAAVALLNDAKAAVAAAQAEAQAALKSAPSSEHLERRLADADRRLAEAEADVSAAAAQREEAEARAVRAEAEVARLGREIESGANEHRAALTSARNRLAEEQARCEGLERELADLRQQGQSTASQRETVNVNLAQANAAKDRLAADVERLTAEVAAKGAVAKDQTGRLDALRAELSQAHARIAELEARLRSLESEAEADRERLPEMEARLIRAQAERTQLLAELDRLRGELVTAAEARRADDSERENGRAELQQAIERALALEAAAADSATLRQQLTAANVQLDAMRAELAAIADRERSATSSLEAAQERIAVESSRWETADQLLARSREQTQSLSADRDHARLDLAQSEATRKTLETQLGRLRAELERIKSASAGTEHDPMPISAQERARLEALEHELTDARRQLQDLGLRETQRFAMLQEERDELARELAEARNSPRSVPAGGDSARVRELEGTLAIERSKREKAEAQLQAITIDVRRLEEESEQLRNGEEMSRTRRRLQQTRRRLRELESERDAALTRAQPQENDGIEHLRREIAAMSAGAPRAAVDTSTSTGERPTLAPQTFEIARPATLRRTATTFSGMAPSPATTLVTERARKLFRPSRRALVACSGAVAVAALMSGTLWRMSAALPGTAAAVVNANVTRIHASVDGTVAGPMPRVGDGVEDGERLMLLRKPKPDISRLLTLQERLTENGRQIATLEKDHQLRAAELDTARLKAEQARIASVAEANARVDEQSRSIESLQQRQAANQGALTALEALRVDGKIGASEVDSLRREAASLGKELLQRRETLAAARRRVEDLQSAATHANPELADLGSSVESFAAKLAAAKLERDDLGVRVTAEEARLAEPTDIPVAASQGMIWKRWVADGQEVRAGDVLCEVAHPASMIVEAVFPPEMRDRLRNGDAARIRLSGTQEVLDGVIDDIMPNEPHRTATVKTLRAPLGSVRAAIRISGHADERRLLGQNAEVILLGGDPGPFDRFLGWLRF